jgi:glycosyltransferase involved in cell wall biosynthesis
MNAAQLSTPTRERPPEVGLPAPISEPYLLVLFSVPFVVDADGRRWIDALWAKDLSEHTRYIRRLTLASPRRNGTAPAHGIALDELPELAGITCVDLPSPGHLLSALAMLPRTAAILWKAIGAARFVHSGVAGWPIPEAWILVPLLALRKRPLYLNVESAFWRLVPGDRPTLRRRLRAWVCERLNRACVERSDLATFTHEGYRRSLMRRHPERGHVGEASWIDDADVLSAADAHAAAERRRHRSSPLRLVFAGRLTREKGVELLLSAAAQAARGGASFQLELFGDGPLADECAETIRTQGLAASARMRGTLPYGAHFFAALREFDALLVPTLSDEQPRIVFDAYAQGLPVVASRTDGLAQCVLDGVTGRLVARGDVAAWCTAMIELAARPAALADMSLACVERARDLTHQQMHRKRWRLLVDRFPALTGAA